MFFYSHCEDTKSIPNDKPIIEENGRLFLALIVLTNLFSTTISTHYCLSCINYRQHRKFLACKKHNLNGYNYKQTVLFFSTKVLFSVFTF